MIFRKSIAAAIALTCGILLTGPSFAAPGQATTSVNVRSGPGTAYGVVDVLRGGERVDIGQCRSGWCRIEHTGPDGWVSARYLSRTGGNTGPVYRDNNTPDIGFCIDAPNFQFGINCDVNNDRRGRPDRQVGQVCFYENFNYRGNSFCARPGQTDRRLSGYWNDRISSIRVRGNASATVCEDFGFRGRCASVNNSIRRIDGRNNDVISSYRVR